MKQYDTVTIYTLLMVTKIYVYKNNCTTFVYRYITNSTHVLFRYNVWNLNRNCVCEVIGENYSIEMGKVHKLK